MSAPEHADVVVYADPDGITYVGCFDGDWYAWPAEQDGWQRRRGTTDEHAARCAELPPELARLALRLSGLAEAERS